MDELITTEISRYSYEITGGIIAAVLAGAGIAFRKYKSWSLRREAIRLNPSLKKTSSSSEKRITKLKNEIELLTKEIKICKFETLACQKETNVLREIIVSLNQQIDLRVEKHSKEMQKQESINKSLSDSLSRVKEENQGFKDKIQKLENIFSKK